MKKRICTSLTVLALTCLLVMPLFAQAGSQVAIITVSGSGKTQDEAKQNALRNAIEQAFGTFISSNTQILNDELVKDEIVSVSSGNIQEFSIISEVQTPDGYWSNTLKAKVAIDKLTSFCESKGVTVEFKGSLFAINIKQQILFEQNEQKVFENLEIVLKKIFSRSFDYKIATNQPTSIGNNWKVPVLIEATLNNNFIQASQYLHNTLKGITMKNEDIENYLSLKKKIYYVAFQPCQAKTGELIALRSEGSLQKICNIINDLRPAMYNFTVYNDVEEVFGEQLWEVLACLSYGQYIPKGFNINGAVIKSIDFIPVLSMQEKGGIGNFFSSREIYCTLPLYLKHHIDFAGRDEDGPFWDVVNRHFKFVKKWQFLFEYSEKFGKMVINLNNLTPGYSKASINYENHYSIDQIQKISEYKIIPKYK